MRSKKFVFSMLLIVLGGMVGFTSCEESDGGDLSIGFAPSNPVNKEFRLYATSGSGRWSVKMLPGVSNGEGLVLVNSTIYLVEEPKVWYSKTGPSTANLSCMFNAMHAQTTGLYGTFFHYDVQLVFTTPHQGFYSGTCSSGGIGELKEEFIHGQFAYDTEDDPNPSTGTDNPDSGNEGGGDIVYDDRDITGYWAVRKSEWKAWGESYQTNYPDNTSIHHYGSNGIEEQYTQRQDGTWDYIVYDYSYDPDKNVLVERMSGFDSTSEYDVIIDGATMTQECDKDLGLGLTHWSKVTFERISEAEFEQAIDGAKVNY